MAVKKEIRDKLKMMEGWDINSVDPYTWNMSVVLLKALLFLYKFKSFHCCEMASMGLSWMLYSSIGNLRNIRTM